MEQKAISHAYLAAQADFDLDNEVSLTGLNTHAEAKPGKGARPHKKKRKGRKNKSLINAFKPCTLNPDTEHVKPQKKENVLPYVLVGILGFMTLGNQKQDTPPPAPGTTTAQASFSGYFRCTAYPGTGVALEHVEKIPADKPSFDLAGQPTEELTRTLVPDPKTGTVADLTRISVESKSCQQALKTLKERHPAFKAYL